LANVGYFKGQQRVTFDNKSVWDKELKPGTITFVEAAPIVGPVSLAEVMEMQVHVHLQNGRGFWLKGTGPGQLRTGSIQRIAFSFWIRDKSQKAAVPME